MAALLALRKRRIFLGSLGSDVIAEEGKQIRIGHVEKMRAWHRQDYWTNPLNEISWLPYGPSLLDMSNKTFTPTNVDKYTLGIRMDRDEIAEVGFDEQGRLYVMPLAVTFPYVYREAMEVAWDDEGHYLCAPPPPRSLLAPVGWWLRQIFAAAKAQDCELHLAPETILRNIPYQLEDEIKKVLSERRA